MQDVKKESTPHPVAENGVPVAAPAGASTKAPLPRYEVRDGCLFKVDDGNETCMANFSPRIVAEHVHIDEDVVFRRDFHVDIQLNNRLVSIVIPAEDFCSGKIIYHITSQAGAEAIIYASPKELRIAIQNISPKPVPVKTITTSMGFNDQGSYLAPQMLISGKGIEPRPEVLLNLSEGNLSRNIGFAVPDPGHMKGLVGHIHADFLQIKDHSVTYPLIGHVVLAVFASRLPMIGKQKPVMHLQGPSGGGKTFLGNLAASFYGTFGDRPLPWTSTANAIESEGFLFRDALFFIDDFKAAIVNSNKLTRIIQNSANSQGRARLSSGGGYKLTPMRGVRGLILSTGEDFISDVESVVGRTLLINVEPEQKQRAGTACWHRRGEYRMLIPGLLQWLLSQGDWEVDFRGMVSDCTESLRGDVANISNGMRVASNWALNAFGFELFAKYSLYLGVIDRQTCQHLFNEYCQIVEDHITAHAGRLMQQNPVEVFFRVISQKFAVNTVRVTDLSDNKGGRLIGKVRDNNIVCLFPDPTLEIIYRHFRSIGQRLPFSKEMFRDALDRENLLIRSGHGRIAHQVRMNGSRLQAWQFDITQFKARCGLK